MTGRIKTHEKLQESLFNHLSIPNTSFFLSQEQTGMKNSKSSPHLSVQQLISTFKSSWKQVSSGETGPLCFKVSHSVEAKV